MNPPILKFIPFTTLSTTTFHVHLSIVREFEFDSLGGDRYMSSVGETDWCDDLLVGLDALVRLK
jgi:hypothetical protein